MEKQPRQYAAEIIALPTRACRAEALLAVPEKFRDWVRELVEDFFWRRSLQSRRGGG